MYNHIFECQLLNINSVFVFTFFSLQILVYLWQSDSYSKCVLWKIFKNTIITSLPLAIK